MRKYYGFEHAYGAQTGDANGDDLGECHEFDTKAERDAWVAARRTEFRTERGYREAYPASRGRRRVTHVHVEAPPTEEATAVDRVLFEVTVNDQDSDQLYPFGVRWEMTGNLAPDGENQVAEIVCWEYPENVSLDHIARLLDLDRCVVSYRQMYAANQPA